MNTSLTGRVEGVGSTATDVVDKPPPPDIHPYRPFAARAAGRHRRRQHRRRSPPPQLPHAT